MENIIAILGLCLAAATFYYSFYKNPTDEINHLKVQFKATQEMSKSVQIGIEEYATRYDAWEEQIFQGVSYKAYLNLMKESYKENLSDDLYKKTLKLNLSKPIAKSMTKSLEQQFPELQQIKMRIKVLSQNSI